MISKTSLATSLRALLLVLALGVSSCVFDRHVKDTETPSGDATVYGEISVSVDHVSTH
jgi:hypothetical protein